MLLTIERSLQGRDVELDHLPTRLEHSLQSLRVFAREPLLHLRWSNLPAHAELIL